MSSVQEHFLWTLVFTDLLNTQDMDNYSHWHHNNLELYAKFGNKPHMNTTWYIAAKVPRYASRLLLWLVDGGRFTFEQIHNTNLLRKSGEL